MLVGGAIFRAFEELALSPKSNSLPVSLLRTMGNVIFIEIFILSSLAVELAPTRTYCVSEAIFSAQMTVA